MSRPPARRGARRAATCSPRTTRCVGRCWCTVPCTIAPRVMHCPMSQSGVDRSRRSGGVSALISGLRPRTSLCPCAPQLCTLTSASVPMQGTATVMCFGMENFVRLLSVLPLGLIDAGPSADGSRRKSDSGREESLDPTALRLALGQVDLHLCLASFAPLCLGHRRQASPASPPHAMPPHTLPLSPYRCHGSSVSRTRRWSSSSPSSSCACSSRAIRCAARLHTD